MTADAFQVRVLLDRPFRRHPQRIPGTRTGPWSLDPSDVGDCFRACLASLVAADDLEDVPHFLHQRNVDEYLAGVELPWHDIRLAREWLRAQALDLANIDRALLDELGARYIVTVRSHRGPWNHAVIAHRGAVVFDPSQHPRPYTFEDLHPEETGGLALAEPYDPDPVELLAGWKALTE